MSANSKRSLSNNVSTRSKLSLPFSCESLILSYSFQWWFFSQQCFYRCTTKGQLNVRTFTRLSLFSLLRSSWMISLMNERNSFLTNKYSMVNDMNGTVAKWSRRSFESKLKDNVARQYQYRTNNVQVPYTRNQVEEILLYGSFPRRTITKVLSITSIWVALVHHMNKYM